MATFDLNDLHCDVGNISHLIQTIHSIFQDECIHTLSEDIKVGDRMPGMDRLGALLWIARDLADGMDKNISDNFGAIGSTCRNWSEPKGGDQ